MVLCWGRHSQQGELGDVVGNRKIIITRDKSGSVAFIDEKTNKSINRERSFWFAWYAFHPDTALYNSSSQT